MLIEEFGIDPVILRPASAADAGEVADIDHAARLSALPDVRWPHTPSEKRHWIAETLIPSGGVHVAVEGGHVVGYVALRESWVDQLYVLPGQWRHGIGRALLQLAKERYPRGLTLYCFHCSPAARRFYESQGFTGAAAGNGAINTGDDSDMLFGWCGGAEGEGGGGGPGPPAGAGPPPPPPPASAPDRKFLVF